MAALVAAAGFAVLPPSGLPVKGATRIRQPRPSFCTPSPQSRGDPGGVPDRPARALRADLPRGWRQRYVDGDVDRTREVRLSGHDADMLQRGYYEDLLERAELQQPAVAGVFELAPSIGRAWRTRSSAAARGDFLDQELAPSMEIHFRNATLRTNRWGMRDKDYQREPPPGTYRFALVGSSHVMGYGVDDDETFDAILEGRLNSGTSGASPRYEVLNFAVDGYTPLQELFQLETRDLEFKPNAVLYVAHYGAPHRTALHLVDMVRTGVPIPYPELNDILKRAGVGHGIGRFEGEQRIQKYQDEILSWTYRRMVTDIETHGATPVWVYLPQMGDHVPPEALAHFIRMAEDAGFTTISLADCFGGAEPDSVTFGEWDRHPNAVGHRLIAEKLYQRLQERAIGRVDSQDAVTSHDS